MMVKMMDRRMMGSEVAVLMVKPAMRVERLPAKDTTWLSRLLRALLTVVRKFSGSRC